jgi:LuxR family maltose regulon positive regulatory protein
MRADPSLSFAPLDRPIEQGHSDAMAVEASPRDRAVSDRPRRRRPRLVVEGGRSAVVAARLVTPGGPLGGMSEYPVQISKVQAPPLRDETLARDRLLDWLSVKIHRRAVLLTAEAGYGKTTLLADFTRRTRLRVLWFRLDRGDRDWVGFIAYLVAAFRIHLPDFGAATSALLRETATSAPPMDTVLDTFLRELSGLPNDPTALVLDDFHLVDDSPDVRHIVRELLTRAPERMSFIFASRREPPVRLARLRALGEVAELGTDDLRFDAGETERLFRETYEMRLEPAMLAELNRRTEGWAASLQLVRAALHDRDPGQVRSFISSLSGAEGHLYEYLAEEVIGELPPDLQQFLMRTSLLETVDLVLGPVAAEVDEAAARAFIEDGERHGLFSRGGPRARHVVRAHPLVRDFLQARVARAVGEEQVRTIHLRVARAAEAVDWRVAALHYLAGNDQTSVAQVLTGAIDRILASGSYALAHELGASVASNLTDGSASLVIRSRMALQRGDTAVALDLAEEAWRLDPVSSAVLLTLASARVSAGDVAAALDAVRQLEGRDEPTLGQLAQLLRLTMEASLRGSIPEAAERLASFAMQLRTSESQQYLGIALLNASLMRFAMGEFDAARSLADEAISVLQSSSNSLELVAARLARAAALAYEGAIDEARREYRLADQAAGPNQRKEIAHEVSHLEVMVGEASLAWQFLSKVELDSEAMDDNGEQVLYARLLLRARDGNLDGAARDASLLQRGVIRSSPAFEARRYLAASLVSCLRDEPAAEIAQFGAALAERQGARLWSEYGRCLAALSSEGDPSAAVIEAATRLPVVISMLAEPIMIRVSAMSAQAQAAVEAEAVRRPWRWREPSRRVLQSPDPRQRLLAARLLEEIGEVADIRLLRSAARSLKGQHHSRSSHVLARRLAERVFVEDLGRVRIEMRTRTIEGSDVRRKVLALLCLLLSRPGLAATREEVVDALWPDNDPASALNSLNQTVYFLRRVFEPEYSDDLSPGYVGQDGETVWLDRELVSARSRSCMDIVRGIAGDPSPDQALALAAEYRGRFALDFLYEDWSFQYRDSLHAAYLRVVERAIHMDLDAGQFARGTLLAERAAEIDPDSEEVQVALVRLYRLSGAHAAAAEQYGHYERLMRDLGIDPRALADL